MDIKIVRENLSNEYNLECERELARHDINKAIDDENNRKTKFIRMLQPIVVGSMSLFLLYILYVLFRSFLF